MAKIDKVIKLSEEILVLKSNIKKLKEKKNVFLYSTYCGVHVVAKFVDEAGWDKGTDSYDFELTPEEVYSLYNIKMNKLLHEFNSKKDSLSKLIKEKVDIDI